MLGRVDAATVHEADTKAKHRSPKKEARYAAHLPNPKRFIRFLLVLGAYGCTKCGYCAELHGNWLSARGLLSERNWITSSADSSCTVTVLI